MKLTLTIYDIQGDSLKYVEDHYASTGSTVVTGADFICVTHYGTLEKLLEVAALGMHFDNYSIAIQSKGG